MDAIKAEEGYSILAETSNKIFLSHCQHCLLSSLICLAAITIFLIYIYIYMQNMTIRIK